MPLQAEVLEKSFWSMPEADVVDALESDVRDGITEEEVLEQCADFRQEECVEDSISQGGIKFSQAACRVNRWRGCTLQGTQEHCEDGTERDCIWKVE